MMGLQRTFIFSLLLHGTFAALLLLSVRFQGESGKMLNEKVFFIDLKSDAYEPEIHRSLAIPKDTILKRPAVKKASDEEIISKDAVSEKRETNLTESLSINAEEATGIAEGSDKTLFGKRMGYANSEENIISSKTEDNKSGELSEAEALKLISAAIERVKTYPKIANRRGFEGTVYVSFFISAEGEPSEITVIKGSGHAILDEATMKVIKKAAPYPYIEDRVEVPVTYRLDD